MDKLIASRLDSGSSRHDSALYDKLAKAARDYIESGVKVLEFYTADLDAAHDAVQCYAQPEVKTDFDKIDRTDPDNFTHPMTATEIETLACFVSQILFGGNSARKVEPRRDEDQQAADMMNELLQWNDDQQPDGMYQQGFLWIKDALTFNRGIMYDHWQHTPKIDKVEIEMEMPDTGEKFTRWKTVRTKAGGFNKVEIISPYDFICDPMLPLRRFQEGRFAGHRVMIPWIELERRSKLNSADYAYVLPKVVEKLKNRPVSAGARIGNSPSSAGSQTRSRSYYERMRRGIPAGYLGGTDKINTEDGGVVECFAVIIRARPSTVGLYDEDDEPELIELLVAGDTDLLSANILPNKHDQFPYAIGEARPHAHYQFSPSWALIIKPLQDYVDYLKNRHKESLARTSGNVFVCDPAKVDIEAFTDPKKDGLVIPITPEAAGTPLDQLIKQIAVIDTTKDFHKEMEMWISHAEITTGAHAYVQGQTEDPSQTATQFAGVQQMATGRISSIARLLSVQALVPQTRRIAMNLQQFMPDDITVKITSNDSDIDPDAPQAKFLQIKKADIQSEFDAVPHDGSLPGTDARKIAALSRGVEAFAGQPALAQIFNDTEPGNLNARAMFYALLRATGLPLRNFVLTRDQALKNLLSKMQAQGLGVPPGGLPPSPNGNGNGAPVPRVDTGTGMTIPSAAQLPVIPSAAPPQIRPSNAP